MKNITITRAGLLLAAAILSVLFSVKAQAIAQVYATDPGDFFDPEEFYANVGDVVYWTRENPTTNIHDVTADSNQGDYRGNKCYEPGGLDGYIYQVNIFYHHQFTVAGDCYYRCTLHPPNPSTGYPGMQGVIHVRNPGSTTTTTTTTQTSTSTTTTTLNNPPSLDSLTPVNISTVPSVAQSFTAVYSDPDGYQNIIDASLALSGSVHSETLHYNPATNRFTLQGVGGNCSPGQATTLSNAYLTLNCNASSASGSGNNLTLTYNLTPQPPISGAGYRLILGVIDQGAVSKTKDMGFWVVNRPPHADGCTPTNGITPVGTGQTFVCVFSDPDGYQNIAEASLYLAGGMHNEWLHYIAAANKYFIMGAPGVCTPGQATTLSNGYLTFDCAASSVSGGGNNLTIIFRASPLGPSSGISYNMFAGVSDQAGAAYGAFVGTWQIQ